MPQLKYARDIEAMRIAQAESAIILQNLADGQTAILVKLGGHEKCVKIHGKLLVALETWRTAHEQRHGRHDTEIRGLKGRINAIGAGNALWAAAVSGLTAMFGQQN